MATVMLEWLAQPTFFIGGPMLAVAGFLVWWGLAPAHVDSCISRLPLPVAKRIRSSLEWISDLIEGDDGLSNEQKLYVRNAFKTLDKRDIGHLKQMLVSGHAHNPPNDTWIRLKAIGFVWSNYSGPMGIKPELTHYVITLLEEHENEQMKQDVNNLGILLREGTMIFQRYVHSDDEYADWKSDTDEWVDKTSALIREAFGDAQDALFMMLEPPVAADISGHYDAEHNHELLHLDARLKKLRRLIEKHA